MGEVGAGTFFQYVESKGHQKLAMDDPNSKKPSPDSASDALFDSIFKGPVKPMARAISDGQLSMKMPSGWQMVENKTLPVGYSSVGCRPKDNREVELNIFSGGGRLSEEAAMRFHELLSKPPHALTSAELKNVSEAIGDKADPHSFRILSARTENINGKTVLSIEGHYTSWPISSQIKYVSGGTDGAFVRAVSYTAPTNEYGRYLLQAQRSFQSLIARH